MLRSYPKLESIFSRYFTLKTIESVLHWDSATCMPSGGADTRAQQLAEIQLISQATISTPEVADIIEQIKATEYNNLNDWQKANLLQAERIYRHASAIPAKLLEEFSKAGSECEYIWRTAKPNNDFAGFKPSFDKVINLTREIAAIKAEALGLSAYDAMLDSYDYGTKSVDIDAIFAELKTWLPNLIDTAVEISERRNTETIDTLKATQSIQKKLGIAIMQRIGFDQNKGRLDESSHPFCGGYPGDVRITTRYDENNMLESLMGVLHETGHAMYEAGLPEESRFQPVGQAGSMTLHESQSLFVEMQMGRSKAFMNFLSPLLSEIANLNVSSEELLFQTTKVRRSMIRVGADEVTYPMHVIMRYELEKEILEGNLRVNDLPDAWNSKMGTYLGIKPRTFSEGCMQDIHWTDGSFGYFPTYTLGAMFAAQLADSIRVAIPEFESMIEAGNFTPIFAWLGSNVHSKASLLTPMQLIKEATGASLGSAALKNHLMNRYCGIT